MAHSSLTFLSDLATLFSNYVLMYMQNVNTPVPHYDNKDHYSFSLILTLPIPFPSICPAEALII